MLPRDRNSNEYWWSDPQQTNIGTDFNIGHRTANTTSSGNSPWSCASAGGDIWLIPSHIGDYVIQHE